MPLAASTRHPICLPALLLLPGPAGDFDRLHRDFRVVMLAWSFVVAGDDSPPPLPGAGCAWADGLPARRVCRSVAFARLLALSLANPLRTVGAVAGTCRWSGFLSLPTLPTALEVSFRAWTRASSLYEVDPHAGTGYGRTTYWEFT